MTLEQKVDKIFDTVNEMKVQQAEHIAYTKSNQKENEKKLSEHDNKINILEANRNQELGKKIIGKGLYGIFCSALGAGIMLLFKH